MSLYDIAVLLSLLFAGHALGDFALQTHFMATAKNRQSPIPGIGWWHALLAHSAIHGAIVGLITGSLMLGVLEFIVHCVIDDLKCAERISMNMDQALHLACKVLWVVLLVMFGPLP